MFSRTFENAAAVDMFAYTLELLSTMRISLATPMLLFKMLLETRKFFVAEVHLFSAMVVVVLAVYLTATQAKEPSVMYSIGTWDAPTSNTPAQCDVVAKLTGQV
jgi:hypothetical protein